MNYDRLKSDGTASGTSLGAEDRGVLGEESWWQTPSGAGVAVTHKTALGLSAYLAAITVLSTDIAVLPLTVYRRFDDRSREKQPQHAVHELMTRSPDGERTPIAWRRSWMFHALHTGNGFAEIERSQRGRPIALHLLDPGTTEPLYVNKKLAYRIGSGRIIPSADVLHISGVGYDGLTGFDPVRLQSETLGLGLAAQSYAADHFANGSDPGGVLRIPKRLDEAGYKRLLAGWEARHQGPGKRKRVALLEEGAEFQQTETNPEDNQLVDTRKFQVLEAIRHTRVPPNKVADLSQAHLANLEASNLDYLMTALLGWLETIEQEINLKLFTRGEWLNGYYVEHNVDALLRGDIRTRFEAYSKAITGGWMSRNEVRARENMNPIPANQGGDLYTVQSQNIPLGQSGANASNAGNAQTDSA